MVGRSMLVSSDVHPGTCRIFSLRYELPLTGPDRSRCL
jgi:hypothetical protein